MPVVERTIDIRAPIETVFAAVTDPGRGPEWNPNILEVSGVEYPIREGSTWQQTVLVAGRRMHLTCRVVRYDPSTLGELIVSGDQQGHIWTQCEPVGPYSRVTQRMEFTSPGGMLGRMVGGFATRMVAQELNRSLERQRMTLETEAGGRHGSGA